MGYAAKVKNKLDGTVYSISTVAMQKNYPTQFGQLPGDYESAVYKGKPGAFKRPLAFIVYAAGNEDRLDAASFHRLITEIAANSPIKTTQALQAALEAEGYTVRQEGWRQLNFGLKKSTYMYLWRQSY